MTESLVYLRLPDGEQFEWGFDFLPRVGDTVHFRDRSYRVQSVEFRLFGEDTVFRPVLALEEAAQ
jgi:hypothetical protein